MGYGDLLLWGSWGSELQSSHMHSSDFPLNLSPQPWVPVSPPLCCLPPFTMTVMILMTNELKMCAALRGQDSGSSHTTWKLSSHRTTLTFCSLNSHCSTQHTPALLGPQVHTCPSCVWCTMSSLLWRGLLALCDTVKMSLLQSFPRTSKTGLTFSSFVKSNC